MALGNDFKEIYYDELFILNVKCIFCYFPLPFRVSLFIFRLLPSGILFDIDEVVMYDDNSINIITNNKILFYKYLIPPKYYFGMVNGVFEYRGN